MQEHSQFQPQFIEWSRQATPMVIRLLRSTFLDAFRCSACANIKAASFKLVFKYFTSSGNALEGNLPPIVIRASCKRTFEGIEVQPERPYERTSPPHAHLHTVRTHCTPSIQCVAKVHDNWYFCGLLPFTPDISSIF